MTSDEPVADTIVHIDSGYHVTSLAKVLPRLPATMTKWDRFPVLASHGMFLVHSIIVVEFLT